MPNLKKAVHDFYNRNLFERIIIYVLMSELLVQIIFEIGMGQWFFIQGQNRQWAFYLMLALDYLVSVKKVSNIRFTVNVTSCMAFVFFIMVAHGIFVGLVMGNRPFTVINDTIPLLMIGMNILRFQSEAEYKPIDMRFLIITCATIVLTCGFLGYTFRALMHRSTPYIAGAEIYFPLFFATLFTFKRFPKWIIAMTVCMVVITVDDINRTTMAFFAIVLMVYLLVNTVKFPVRGLVVSIILVLGLAVAVNLVSEESKTYRRVVALTEVDLSDSTGSIGERQEEWRAINRKYDRLGPTVEFFGLGFGGVYEVARTHAFLKDYGHAHYSWAWFKLRFGQVGYVYLLIFVLALAYNGFVWGLRFDSVGFFMLCLCLVSLLYCFTYLNAALLMMGIQFAYHRADRLFGSEKEEDDDDEIVRYSQQHIHQGA